MDEAQLKAFIDKKVENRRHKRYSRLVDERPISVSIYEYNFANDVKLIYILIFIATQGGRSHLQSNRDAQIQRE